MAKLIENAWIAPAGPQYAINTDTAQVKLNFSDGMNMIALSNGNQLVVWDHFPDTGIDEVHGQVLSPTGTPLGDPFVISVPIPEGGGMDQWSPAVTATTDGGFFVAWTAEEYNNGYNTGRNVLGRLYDNDGTPRTDPFVVANQLRPDGSVVTSSWEAYPAVATLPDGRFVVAFHDDGDIGVRVVSADGARSDTLTAAIVADRSQTRPAVTVLADGGFVVSWDDDKADGSWWAVRAQIYDPAGARVGGPFQINETTSGDQDGAKLAALADGGFAAIFRDNNAEAAVVRIFNADGSPRTGEIQTDPGYASSYGGEGRMSIVALPDGGFVTAWQARVSYFGVEDDLYGQRFDANGNPVGDRFTIVTAIEDQWNPRLAVLDNGDLAASWYSYESDADHPTGVYGRVFHMATLDGTPTPGDDFLVLSDIDQSLALLGGDDTVSSGAGNDDLKGGAGADVIDGGAGRDVLAGGTGDDQLAGSGGRDVLAGGKGNDTVLGGSGNDRLFGDDGRDELSGGAGDDRLEGGTGRDGLNGGDGNDTAQGGNGRDALTGGAGNDLLDGGARADTLAGGTGRDTVQGGNGNDELSGGSGRDRLEGGNGADRLDGGLHNDVLIGGPGRDTFVFSAGDDVVRDFATGGTATDVIDLSAAVGIADFADLVADHITDLGRHLAIADDAGNSLKLLDVDPADLTADHFLF